jgi:hypothetical protein
MESPEHQEWRSRQQVSWPAIYKTGLGMGLFLFIFSGGTPWTSGGIVSSVMGRGLPWPWPLLIVAHFGLALLYMAIIAHIIYRFRVWMGVAIGLITALGLYAINYAILHGWSDPRDDGRALAAHIVLGLFGSAIYKAISTPRPQPSPGEVMDHEPRRA